MNSIDRKELSNRSRRTASSLGALGAWTAYLSSYFLGPGEYLADWTANTAVPIMLRYSSDKDTYVNFLNAWKPLTNLATSGLVGWGTGYVIEQAYLAREKFRQDATLQVRATDMAMMIQRIRIIPT